MLAPARIKAEAVFESSQNRLVPSPASEQEKQNEFGGDGFDRDLHGGLKSPELSPLPTRSLLVSAK